jgi:hypothetical protein
MKTHNALIYHCLCCGRVVHQEPLVAAPHCCGVPMTEAAAETICEAEGTAPEGDVEVGSPVQPHLRSTRTDHSARPR